MITAPTEINARVAIFRLQMFKPSEVFITEQARFIPGFDPVFVGRDIFGKPPQSFRSYPANPQGTGRCKRVYSAIISPHHHYMAAMRNEGAGLVHAHFGVDAVDILPVTKKLDIPLVTTFHGFDATTRMPRLLASGSPSLTRYAIGRRRLANQGTMFLCVSEFIKQRVLALGFPEERVIRHYIGTDISKFTALKRIGHHDRPVILHVARLVEKKGTKDLISAFADVVRTVPEAQLVIIGEGPLRPQLQKQIHERNLSQSVQLLGSRPHGEVLDWLAKAAIFALPSITATNGDTEGLPISIIEAAAAGLPIVATWHSGIPEAVRDQVDGFLVDEHDAETLAARLCDLLRDDTLRMSMGKSAQQYVMQNFDIREQSSKLADIYRAVA